MNLIERIKKRTPRKDRIKGQIATTIGSICGAVLATGLIVNPIGILCLTVGTIIFGGKALYHAQKVVK
tara:strand:+ start:360 stop:563 length:204 start_codon:yes stop_codon:yes gene_type:complete